MKSPRRCFLLLAVALGTLAGCTAPDVANTLRNRDHYARLADQAQRSTGPDGSLRGDYVVDKIVNGPSRSISTPVFDQPRGN